MKTASPSRALAAALLGFFIITLDALVVSVALPAIRATLGGGITGLQWVMDGYTLPFAALLLLAGTLSDCPSAGSRSGCWPACRTRAATRPHSTGPDRPPRWSP